jgi:hypothetical protein
MNICPCVAAEPSILRPIHAALLLGKVISAYTVKSIFDGIKKTYMVES